MENLLSVKNLSAFYGNRQILKDISFTLEKGELVCLCGPNGCGKSTLLNILAGTASSGLIVRADELPEYLEKIKSRKETARKIAFLCQSEVSAWDVTVKDFVLTGRYPYSDFWGNYSRIDIETAEMACVDFSLENIWNKSVLEISGGEYQRSRIARSFVQETDFLFMDEPLSNLDMVYEHKLMKLLSEKAHSQNKGIIISVHDINMAIRFADRIMLLPPCSEMMSGKTSEIVTVSNLKKTYGADFHIRENFVELV